MSLQDECNEVLIRLGLTNLQATVYLSLCRLGRVSIKTISNDTKIDRAHIYQVINRLQEIGLVQKILKNPNLFESISLQEGLQILLERKDKEFTVTRQDTETTITKLRNYKSEDLPNDDCQFVLIPGKEAHSRVFNKLFEKTQTTYDGIFLRQEDFSNLIIFRKEDHTYDLIEKGVKIRLVVCRSNKKDFPTSEVTRIIKKMNTDGLFQIRYSNLCAAAMFGIIDKKEIYINVGSASEWKEKPSLRSNNPRLVAIAQGYFDYLWRESTED
jgi:sugar-specific transcriptional regulator TrmB